MSNWRVKRWHLTAHTAHFEFFQVSSSLFVSMKTMLVLLLFGTVATFGSINAVPCNTTALANLLVTADVRTCRTDSGYNPMSMAPATDAQVAAVCNSNACRLAIDAVKQVAPTECTIGPVRLYAEVISPLQRRCGRTFGLSGCAGMSGSASGSGFGPAVGAVGPQSGSGSVVGSTITPANASMSGSAIKSPTTSSPRSSVHPRSDTPKAASGNDGAETPTRSMITAVAVLAAVIAAIL